MTNVTANTKRATGVGFDPTAELSAEFRLTSTMRGLWSSPYHNEIAFEHSIAARASTVKHLNTAVIRVTTRLHGGEVPVVQLAQARDLEAVRLAGLVVAQQASYNSIYPAPKP